MCMLKGGKLNLSGKVSMLETEKIKSRNQSGGSKNVVFPSSLEYIFCRLTSCRFEIFIKKIMKH